MILRHREEHSIRRAQGLWFLFRRLERQGRLRSSRCRHGDESL